MTQHWQTPHTRRRTDRRELELRRARRDVRRTADVAEAVRRLGADADHRLVAEATGLPVGYLRWAFPDLAAAGSATDAATA